MSAICTVLDFRSMILRAPILSVCKVAMMGKSSDVQIQIFGFQMQPNLQIQIQIRSFNPIKIQIRWIWEKWLNPDLNPNPDLDLPAIVVYRLKSVEAIKMKFVAPMPEQISTTTILLTCPMAHQGNALLGFQLVLAWVQRISNFWSSDDRLLYCKVVTFS